ncbi:MAG: hypothetical protein WBB69_01445 [Anaerolineales bacterium]
MNTKQGSSPRKNSNCLTGSEKTIWTRLLKWFLFLPVLIYLPGIFGGIPFVSETAQYTDLLLTHYPNAIFLKNAILEHLAIPFWSNLIYSGMPFAANPLSGLWYLPGWIALIFPLPSGISIVLALHSVMGAWGFYKLMIKEGTGEFAGILAGIAFGLLPKTAAHFGAGHVSLLYAIAWTPWLIMTTRTDDRGWKTGLIMAGLFTADPRWSIFAGLLWASYIAAHRQIRTSKKFKFYLNTGLIAFLLASPLLLPLLEFTSFSTRSNMMAEDVFAFSLPPKKLLGIFIPGQAGNPEWFMYVGGLLILIFIIQLWRKKDRRKNAFWLSWLGISLVISFGSYIPGVEWLAKMPVISLLRVPARALFITGICFAAIAGGSSEDLIRGKIPGRIIRLTSFGVVLFSLLLGGIVAVGANKAPLSLYWGFGFFIISAVGTVPLNRINRLEYKQWILIGILTVDLLGAGYLSYSVKTRDQVFARPEKVIRFIQDDEDLYRLYSPSHSVPQYIAVIKAAELADGVDPLQIESYAKFMAEASGVNESGYFVTIPPFKTGNPKNDNKDYEPDPFLLGLLNVKYIVSEFEMKVEGLTGVETIADSHIYINNQFLPRAWVQEDDLLSSKELSSEKISPARIVKLSPNKIHLETEGPGTLVLSEINYPGWVVIVDGERQEITPAYGVLRSVVLEDGKHEIIFKFQPKTIYAGLALAAIGWMIFLWKEVLDKKSATII